MNQMDQLEMDASPLDHQRARRGRTTGFGSGKSAANGHSSLASSEFASMLELLMEKWRWIAGGGLAGLLVGLLFGIAHFESRFSAVAQLVRYESPNSLEVFRPQQVSPQTFANLLRSPEVLQRVSAQANPPLTPQRLAASLRVAPERNSDIVMLILSGENAENVVDLANLYAREAVKYTQELQAQEAATIRSYLTQQLALIDREIRGIGQTVATLPSGALQPLLASGPLAGKLSERLTERLQLANEELADLLAKYTEAHPAVKGQRAKITAIEQQMVQHGLKLMGGNGGTNLDAAESADPGAAQGTAATASSSQGEVLVSKLQALETSKLTLNARLRGAELFETQPAGYYRILASASLDDLVLSRRDLKVLSVTAFMGLLGVVLACLSVGLVELTDRRLKTAHDVQRVTGLPVLAAAGNFVGMSLAARQNWAFRVWTALQGRLCRSPNHGLVCGITSSKEGEGRSTWVNLLAQAASERGFRVLTIATQPTTNRHQLDETMTSPPPNGHSDHESATHNSVMASGLAEPGVLASPAEVTQQLVGPDPQPRVHIPIPGWVWNLERRKQWRAALEHWRQIDNIVILVELPPASVPETVLLAENLPNLLWLADSRNSDAGETRSQLESLIQARCNLVGAVLNRAKPTVQWLPRWVAAWAVLLTLFAAPAASGQDLARWPGGGPRGDGLNNFRVIRPSDAQSEAVVTMDYYYDGANGITARVIATPMIRGQKTALPGFDCEKVSVSKGGGPIAVRINYRPTDPALPKERSTDRINVKLLSKDGRTLLAQANFLSRLNWTAQADPGGAAVLTKPVTESPATNLFVLSTANLQPPTPPRTTNAESASGQARFNNDQPAPQLDGSTPNPAKEQSAPAPRSASLRLADTTDSVSGNEPAASNAPPPVLRSLGEGGSTLNEDVPAGSFSASSQRADWQRRLVLGPGDVLNVGIFGQPELSRSNLFVGPDGRISFLEAADVVATGLTVDELRDQLNTELGKYRRSPQVMLSPVEFRSKKYFLLGRVAEKGVFTLDRPTTIVEAVARARGLETGPATRSVVELADLTRAFLARRGQRANVDFEKLFLRGDLSQNIALEPGDYLFFPPAEQREIYVLGEVQLPGVAAYAPDLGAVAAIATRGGFSSKAWKTRILVVRGSLNNPEAFVVDTQSVLAAKAPDLALQPRDIVFVSSRPWLKAEELLDAAAQAFVQAAVIIWTGGNIGPLLR